AIASDALARRAEAVARRAPTGAWRARGGVSLAAASECPLKIRDGRSEARARVADALAKPAGKVTRSAKRRRDRRALLSTRGMHMPRATQPRARGWRPRMTRRRWRSRRRSATP